jgi:ATP-dependent Lon protease
MKIITPSSPGSDAFQKELTLPLVPLKDMVLFPFLAMPLYIGRRFSVEAVEEAATGQQKLIFFVTQKNQAQETPENLDLYSVGCIAEIVHVIKMEDGKLKVLVEGLRRGRLVKLQAAKDLYRGVIEPLPNTAEKSAESEVLRKNLTSLFEEYVKMNRQIPPENIIPVLNIDNVDRLSDSIIALMPLKVKTKQELLSLYQPIQRCRKLLELLKKEIELLKVEKKIDEDVRRRLEDSQKKYFLSEKLKVINEELRKDGDSSSDTDRLEKELKKTKLTKEAREKADLELNRLKALPALSAEYGVIKTWLEWIRDLPWEVLTKDNSDIRAAQKLLDESHYGLEKAKERIVEFIAVRQLVQKGKGPILCFVGPPGVGKTSLARAIAQSIGRNFVRVSLGGVRDEAEIRGHRRTYVGAMPGRVLQSMRKAKSQNPVFLLDEIDKMSTDFRGDPSSALLEVLDPEQNNSFSDHYLEVAFDLSDVFFITTANAEYNIPKPLLDRMELIRLSGYTEHEKLEIAKTFLIKKQMAENGLEPKHLAFPDETILGIIREYTREAGVRELERKIGAVCRKTAKAVVENGKKMKSRTVSLKDLHEFLGKPQYKHGVRETASQPGVVTGLAWTEAGGDVLTIEVSVIEGSGKLILTGKLGEIMQESAQTALSYTRSRFRELGLEKDFYKKYDLHIHIPEGAVPKEGPSAGITIATALISALTRRPARNDTAMTGEITLRGRVLPIGGVKEKVLAAHRAGILKVLLPEENRKDFDDIPENVRKNMTFHFVSDMAKVLELSLSGTEKKTGKNGKKRK